MQQYETPGSVIALKLFNKGLPVVCCGETYHLGENNDVLVERESYTIQPDGSHTDHQKVCLGTCMTVQCFINRFNNMTEEDRVVNIGNLVLNE